MWTHSGSPLTHSGSTTTHSGSPQHIVGLLQHIVGLLQQVVGLLQHVVVYPLKNIVLCLGHHLPSSDNIACKQLNDRWWPRPSWSVLGGPLLFQTRLWLVDQQLYSPKLCEENIHQSKAKTCTDNSAKIIVGLKAFLTCKNILCFVSLETLPIWQYVQKIYIFDQKTWKFFPVT